MLFRRKPKFKDMTKNDVLADRIGTKSDDDYNKSRDPVKHEIEFQSMAKIARLPERLDQLEEAVFGETKGA